MDQDPERALLEFVEWESLWDSESDESNLYDTIIENFDQTEKWDKVAYETKIKQPLETELPQYNEIMEDTFEKDYDKRDVVNEIDCMLLDEEKDHIHYIELKNSENRVTDAKKQVDKASYLFQALGYDFSASFACHNKQYIENYPKTCFERELSRDEPVDLEKVIPNDISQFHHTVEPSKEKYKELLPIDSEKHDKFLFEREDKDSDPFYREESWWPNCLNQAYRWVEIQEPEIKIKDEDNFVLNFPLRPHDGYNHESFSNWFESNTPENQSIDLYRSSENQYWFKIEMEVQDAIARRVRDLVPEASERAWHSASSIQEIL